MCKFTDSHRQSKSKITHMLTMRGKTKSSSALSTGGSVSFTRAGAGLPGSRTCSHHNILLVTEKIFLAI